MNFDLEISESVEGLEELLAESSSPVVVWGHTGLGKSPIISHVIEQLGGTEYKISGSDRPPMAEQFHMPAKQAEPTHVIWEWANRELGMDSFYESIPTHLKNRLVIFAHPPTKEIGYELLGVDLQSLCDKISNGQTANYIANNLPDSVMDQSRHVAILPSAERWISHMELQSDGVVVSFIKALLEKEKTDAYEALYNYLFSIGYDTFPGLSARFWDALQWYINAYGRFVFTGEYEDFNINTAIQGKRWILEDYKFINGTVSGLSQILADEIDKEDFYYFKKLEAESLLSSVDYKIKGNGIGRFYEDFRSYVEKYYKSE